MPVIMEQKGRVFVLRSGTRLPQLRSLIKREVPYWTYFYKYNGILIDAGNPHVAEEIMKFIGEVKFVLLTHHHEDHVGATYLLEKKGVPIYAPKGIIPILRNPPQIPEYRKWVWGPPKPINALAVEDTDFGDLDIEIIDTPGHTEHHYSYRIDEYVFIGDLVASEGRPIIALRGENYPEIMKSIEKVLEYNFEYAFGGTGVYTKETLKNYLNELLELKKEIEEYYRDGFGIKEIVRKVFGRPPEIILFIEAVSKKEWSRENLVKSMLGLG